jgi:hypothetical protein
MANCLKLKGLQSSSESRSIFCHSTEAFRVQLEKSLLFGSEKEPPKTPNAPKLLLIPFGVVGVVGVFGGFPFFTAYEASQCGGKAKD